MIALSFPLYTLLLIYLTPITDAQALALTWASYRVLRYGLYGTIIVNPPRTTCVRPSLRRRCVGNQRFHPTSFHFSHVNTFLNSGHEPCTMTTDKNAARSIHHVLCHYFVLFIVVLNIIFMHVSLRWQFGRDDGIIIIRS